MGQVAEQEGPVFKPLVLQTKAEAQRVKERVQGHTVSVAELTVGLGLLAPRPRLCLATFSTLFF